MITIPLWLFILMCIGLAAIGGFLLYLLHLLLHLFDGF